MQVHLQLIPVCGDRYLQLFLAQNRAECWLTLFQRQVVTPSDDGKLKSNQVDTGIGLNPLYSENKIKDYVSDALSKELKFIGYKLDPQSSLSISGNIAEYSFDYIGLRNVDARVNIEFIITSIADGKNEEIYRKNHQGFYTASKWTSMEFTLMMNEALRNCIKSFVVDAQAKNILG